MPIPVDLGIVLRNELEEKKICLINWGYLISFIGYNELELWRGR